MHYFFLGVVGFVVFWFLVWFRFGFGCAVCRKRLFLGCFFCCCELLSCNLGLSGCGSVFLLRMVVSVACAFS